MRYLTETRWDIYTDIDSLVDPKLAELKAQGIVTTLTHTAADGITTGIREWPTLELAESWAQFCLDVGAISCITKTE